MVSRQAVLLIHGIGEQKPMDTLRGFVDAVWKDHTEIHHKFATQKAGTLVWSKPDSVSDGFELRRLTTPQNRSGIRTDFFEFYWQHLMQDTRFAHLFVRIAGDACGIHEIMIEDDRLIAKTRTGSFSFDVLSHGLALVAMLLWDCVLLDAVTGKGLMLIDEPENHLHPGLQRSLMTTLVREFPSIQFVVATHSPFFVGAARDSRVCLLAYDEGAVSRAAC